MRLRTCIIIFSIFMCLPLAAQDIDERRSQKAELEKEIALIDKQLSENISHRKQNMNNLLLTRRKMEARERIIADINMEIAEFDREISACDMNIRTLDRRLDTLRDYHGRLVLNAYKNRDTRVWYMYIFASKDISQGLRRWSYLKRLSSSVKDQADMIRSTELEIGLEKERLSVLKHNSLSARAEREKEYRLLAAEEENTGKIVNELAKQEKILKKSLEKKKKEVERLNKEIERLLAEALKEQNRKDGIVIDYELSGRFEENKGRLPWPVSDGVIVERFGQNYHPVFKNVRLPFNNGVDISVTRGSNAFCIFDGVVKQVLVMPGYSQCVLVQHGEFFTFYCKLDKVYVKRGDKLKTGDRIGSVDTADDGSCVLHFQLWKGTQKQNPENWISKKQQ
ncbi:MAG TPA: peptidoglycan DD-metalloendopeptidase family protein [Candidatus Coprenecus stercoripullorum]|nr:peptidoglycan DD-metalloendopeptidase family protein [Candidatus Coprenecus stercoripullorum]